MPEWTRDTPWRQGHLLTADSAKALGIDAKDSLVVVISHDCDLATLPEDGEPCVEVLIGRSLSQANENYTYGKHARVLHTNFSDLSEHIMGEFAAGNRASILKVALAEHQPDEKRRFTPEELARFQMWLAARYRRASFPDPFRERLKKVSKKIEVILQRGKGYIVGLYFNLDSNREIIRTAPEDVYRLDIFVIYNSDASSKGR